MVRIIIVLAIVFALAGLFLNPPISSGPSQAPALFGIALDNRPVVRSVDLSPLLGIGVIALFVSWIAKRGGR